MHQATRSRLQKPMAVIPRKKLAAPSTRGTKLFMLTSTSTNWTHQGEAALRKHADGENPSPSRSFPTRRPVSYAIAPAAAYAKTMASAKKAAAATTADVVVFKRSVSAGVHPRSGAPRARGQGETFNSGCCTLRDSGKSA